MSDSQPIPAQFLTPEECVEVDTALLTASEKFSARLAIYALRCLKQISQDTRLTVELIKPEQIKAWMAADETLQKQIEVDSSFQNFFTQLVLSSLKPLQKISSEIFVPIESLTVQQVVAWFEKESKAKQQNSP